MNYSSYQYTKRELIQNVAALLGIFAVFTYVFYHSWLAFLLAIPTIPFLLKRNKKAAIEKRRQELRLQFKEMLFSFSSALAAGYSAERALRQVEKDLKFLYPEQAYILVELRTMIHRQENGEILEQLFFDLGRRSGIAEVESFAEIFSIAKRSGGNLIAIMKRTVGEIQEKIQVETEIQLLLAGKKYEQRIMSLIPLGMVLYLRLANPGFLDQLYGNVVGIAIMTVCLAVYLGALVWAEKILEIYV